MSQPTVIAYDDFATVTPSDTTDDPAGPFVGLYCATSGTAYAIPFARGKGAATSAAVPIPMTAGQTFYGMVRRVDATSTTGTYVGLINRAITPQGT